MFVRESEHCVKSYLIDVIADEERIQKWRRRRRRRPSWMVDTINLANVTSQDGLSRGTLDDSG